MFTIKSNLLTPRYERQCTTAHDSPKKTFKTFEEAVDWAKKQNENPKYIHKQVAYKCNWCLRFHTGRSRHNTLLTHSQNIFENK